MSKTTKIVNCEECGRPTEVHRDSSSVSRLCLGCSENRALRMKNHELEFRLRSKESKYEPIRKMTDEDRKEIHEFAMKRSEEVLLGRESEGVSKISYSEEPIVIDWEKTPKHTTGIVWDQEGTPSWVVGGKDISRCFDEDGVHWVWTLTQAGISYCWFNEVPEEFGYNKTPMTQEEWFALEPVWRPGGEEHSVIVPLPNESHFKIETNFKLDGVKESHIVGVKVDTEKFSQICDDFKRAVDRILEAMQKTAEVLKSRAEVLSQCTSKIKSIEDGFKANVAQTLKQNNGENDEGGS